MADNYVEVFSSWVDFPKPFQRTGKFPLDRTSLFSSYEDAVKYAAGDRTNPDSRGMCGVSYVGQTITVYENGIISDYKINADRTLSKVETVDTIVGTLEVGELSVEIPLPNNGKVVQISITDSITNEQVFTDVHQEESLVRVTIAEAYPNPLNIVITYCS